MSDINLQLKEDLKKIDWPIKYGWVKVKISDGKPVLVIREESDRID